MALIRLVSLMRAPVTMRMGGDPKNDFTVLPSGQEITVKKRENTVCTVGLPDGQVKVVSELPTSVVGEPKARDPLIRYVVMMVVFEAMPDRKDFITPVRPIRDSAGIVRAYRQFRGHDKDEVDGFFREAAASKEETK